MRDHEERARKAFEQAVQLDSLFGGPIEHLARFAFVVGDTAAQREWTRRLLALDSTSQLSRQAVWDLAAATHDTRTLETWSSGRGSGAPASVVEFVLWENTLDSVTVANHDRLLEAARSQATTAQERNSVMRFAIASSLNAGRDTATTRWLESAKTADPGRWALVTAYCEFIEHDCPAPDTTAMRRADPMMLELWRLARGDLAAGSRLSTMLRAEAARDTVSGGSGRLAALVDAWMAEVRGAPDADRLAVLADSLNRGWWSNEAFLASFILPRIFRSQGHLDRAPAAVRRRWIGTGWPNPWNLAISLRIEGQLAAETGDKEGAIRAYQGYLLLRPNPDPRLIPQRDSVKAELAALTFGEGKGKP